MKKTWIFRETKISRTLGENSRTVPELEGPLTGHDENAGPSWPALAILLNTLSIRITQTGSVRLIVIIWHLPIVFLPATGAWDRSRLRSTRRWTPVFGIGSSLAAARLVAGVGAAPAARSAPRRRAWTRALAAWTWTGPGPRAGPTNVYIPRVRNKNLSIKA